MNMHTAIACLSACVLHAECAAQSTLFPLPVMGSSFAYATEACDVDGDGDLDLVSISTASLHISKNSGNRSFPEIVSYSTSDDLTGLATADFDSDGDVDIAVCHRKTSGNNVAVFMNSGLGTFGPQVVYPVSHRAWAIVAADLNGDGHADLVTANYEDDTFTTLTNSGTGTFGTPVTRLTNSNGPIALRAGDVNGDGAIDLVLAHKWGNIVRVRLNSGNNGSGEPTFSGQGMGLPVADNPIALAVADLNGDGSLDIATGHEADSTVGLLFGNGAGAFASPTYINVPDVYGTIAVGDPDGDGDQDMVVASYALGRHTLLRNDGSGVFAQDAIVAVNNVRSITLADLDADGAVDLINSRNYTYHSFPLAVLWNSGDGTYSTRLESPCNEYTLDVNAAVSADFDGDGDVDVASVGTGSGSSGLVCINLNDGTGAIGPIATHALGARPADLVACDLDTDGDIDLAACSVVDSRVQILLSNGNGTFQPAISMLVGQSFDDIDAADVDGDAVPDLVLARSTQSQVLIAIGIGGAAYAAPLTYATGGGPAELCLADLDLDGDIDIATCSTGAPSNRRLSVLRNTGAGEFAPRVDITMLVAPTSVTSGDVDGDGDPDLVVTTSSETINVYRNNGAGTFAAWTNWPTEGDPTSSVTVDIDGDGDIDIVPCFSTDLVTILLNSGNGAFTPDYYSAGRPGHRNLMVADFNGDARPDIATPFVSVLLNQLAPPTCDGDVTGDGSTNIADFNVIASNFGSAVTPNTGGDLTGDGLVTIADFNIVAGNFGCEG